MLAVMVPVSEPPVFLGGKSSERAVASQNLDIRSSFHRPQTEDSGQVVASANVPYFGESGATLVLERYSPVTVLSFLVSLILPPSSFFADYIGEVSINRCRNLLVAHVFETVDQNSDGNARVFFVQRNKGIVRFKNYLERNLRVLKLQRGGGEGSREDGFSEMRQSFGAIVFIIRGT